jgi:hypothetical protein
MIGFEKLVKFFNDYPWAVIMAIQTFASAELFRRLMKSQREHLEDLRTILPLADKLAVMVKSMVVKKRQSYQIQRED